MTADPLTWGSAWTMLKPPFVWWAWAKAREVSQVNKLEHMTIPTHGEQSASDMILETDYDEDFQ